MAKRFAHALAHICIAALGLAQGTLGSADGVCRATGNGNLLEAVNSATTLRFERDDYGRVIREQQGEHWIESGYDAAGRRTHRQTSFGSSCEWSYDPNGQIAALNLPNSQELLFTHDELGRETSRRFGPDFVLRQSYDVMSRITEQAGGDEIRRQFRYDVMSKSCRNRGPALGQFPVYL